MPTRFSFSPCDENPRLWYSLRQAVEREMVAAGWNPKAGKFPEVARRKQRQAWNALQRQAGEK